MPWGVKELKTKDYRYTVFQQIVNVWTRKKSFEANNCL